MTTVITQPTTLDVLKKYLSDKEITFMGGYLKALLNAGSIANYIKYNTPEKTRFSNSISEAIETIMEVIDEGPSDLKDLEKQLKYLKANTDYFNDNDRLVWIVINVSEDLFSMRGKDEIYFYNPFTK